MLWTAFILGLLGSLHCLGMCGPIAIALPRGGAGRIRYVTGRVAYNVGRVVTYTILGLAFGVVGQRFALAGLQQGLSIFAGVVLLVGLFFGKFFAGKMPAAGPVYRLVGQLKRALGSRLQNRSGSSLLVIGLLNGLLPCGLVYAALAPAAATGSAFGGAAYMALFGLGTFPMMLALALGGHLIFARYRGPLLRALPVLLAVLAVLFILRGLSLGIPYLSPDLSTSETAASCCQP